MEFQGLGIMIGSSLDGVDLALVVMDFNSETGLVQKWQLKAYFEFPLSRSIKARVLNYKKLEQEEIVLLENDIADLVTSGINKLALPKTYTFAAYHGITIKHFPEQKISIQLGNCNRLAQGIGVPVISDFRQADMDAGGKGTPMAPIVEQHLFREYDAFLNLGGIANISFHRGDAVLAYDICPFNQVLNYYASKLDKAYDEGGLLAGGGNSVQALKNHLSSFDYFKIEGPKSIDNNWIREDFIPSLESFGEKLEDVLATYTQFVAVLIAQELGRFAPETKALMITGGGAFNNYFVDLLAEQLENLKVKLVLPEPLIIKSKEAILMALAGLLCMKGVVNFIPSVTGATRAVVGGRIYKYET